MKESKEEVKCVCNGTVELKGCIKGIEFAVLTEDGGRTGVTHCFKQSKAFGHCYAGIDYLLKMGGSYG